MKQSSFFVILTARLYFKIGRSVRRLSLLFVLITPIAVPAQDYTYTVKNNKIAITKYTGSDSAVTIPNAINGYLVTSIGTDAFRLCTNLTSIAVPNSITNIGDYSFQQCTSLTDVTIGNGVTRIGRFAFNWCPRLTNITIPDNITTIDDYAFRYCANLTNVTIPDSVSKVGDGAFTLCYGLVRVEIGNGVTSIGSDVFHECTNLTSVTFGNGVTNISSGAFRHCFDLANITIPNSVTYIGDSAFSNCLSLAGVYFKGNIPVLGSSNVFPSSTNTIFYYLPGTAGWGSIFGGRPTVLWNPKIQTGDVDFGVRSNKFGFKISGTNDFTVMVEACTNLADGVWVPVETNTLTDGSAQFSDPAWINYPNRYYRISMPQ